MLGGRDIESQINGASAAPMDRHVEFATQLSHLVDLYVHHADDRAAERTVLRAARAAAKHGAVELTLAEHALHAGTHTLGDDIPHVPMLRDLLVALGITRLDVAHQAKQAEIKAIGHLLADVVTGKTAAGAFAAVLAARKWAAIEVTFGAATPVAVAEEASTVVATVVAEPAVAEPAVAEPEAVEPAVAEPEAAEPAVVEPAIADVEVAEVEVAEVEVADGVVAESPVAEAGRPGEAAAPFVESGPLATHVPAAVERLSEARHRELFERLITSSEPATLRRLLEPIQLAIEQSLREGRVPESLQLLLAMFACEALCTDLDMRRNFVIIVRRLTKPTVLRAFAMLYADQRQFSAEVEQLLVRFGEDGAEAVADRASCAPNAETSLLYTALLKRLPGGRDALVAMLDDQRPHVVERAIGFIVQMRLPDAERVLGEEIGHADPRVRQAAARGLAAFPGSAFAADALLRAVADDVPEVRLTAAVALQSRRESRLAAPIAQRLDVEQELDVQLALIAALGRLAAPEGVHKLIALAMPDQRMLRRRDILMLRLAAIEALGEARTPQSMLALQKLLEDREQEVREAAARLFTRARRQTSTGSIAAVSEP